MGLKITLKKQADLPNWDYMRMAPAVSSAIACSCCADNSNFHPQHGRYIYYLLAATLFYRYDTWTDDYQLLTAPPIAPATWASIRFAGSMGVEGLALAGGPDTITLPGYSGQVLKSFDIRIIGGTGMGQRRQITAVAEPVIHDTGVATAVGNTLGGITISDSTKVWKVNQWAGYQVRIAFGAGIGQVRRILYNSTTALYLGDVSIYAQNNWANPGIFAPAISATAGAQSSYAIESSVATVDEPWETQPDATSSFRIESGMLVLASSAAATPFYTLQYYDVATDTWYIRTANTLNVAAVGTDGTLERCTENSTIWDRGTASGGTATTMVDATKSWKVNQWAPVDGQPYYARIFSGTGEGQLRAIVSNTENTLTWALAGTPPDTTSDYLIDGFDSGTATSAAPMSLTDTTKTWPVDRWNNYAVRITHGTGKGQLVPIISSTATGLNLSRPWLITPDATSTYCIQADTDKLYLMLGGNAATLIHNSEDDLATYGRLLDSGVARIASVQYDSRKAIAITSATHSTNTATITTAIAHCLKPGMSITVRGMTDANFNTTATIIATPATNTFTYAMAGTPATDAVAGAQSTTTLCDKTKAWTLNQWAGYMCYMTVSAVTGASGAATGQVLQIASNTADTLTFVGAGTAPLNGVSRYVITPRAPIGALDHGLATGTQSTTTLQDTNKAGTFTGSITIGTNVLTVSTTPLGLLFPGTAVTHASIPVGAVILSQLTGPVGGAGTYTISANATATVTGGTVTYGWVVNAFAGRKVKFLGGTGQAQELTVTANTNNTLTFATATAPVTLITSYAILQAPVRGVGIELSWFFGLSNPSLRGKFMVIARGGGLYGFDRLDVTTDRWSILPVSPQNQLLTTGSMYAYDGADRFYFTLNNTQWCYYLDLLTNTIHGAGMFPANPGTAIIGNRMEVYSIEDGAKYLWINRHSGQECFRQLLYY